jgi:hypothetical protein
LQLPQGPLAQQTPSVQLPLKHSGPMTQAAPLAFKLVQTFAMQVNPDAQLLVSPQVVRHDTAPHA